MRKRKRERGAHVMPRTRGESSTGILHSRWTEWGDAYQAAFLLASKFVNGPGNSGESSLLKMAGSFRTLIFFTSRRSSSRLSYRHAWLHENAKMQSSSFEEQEVAKVEKLRA